MKRKAGFALEYLARQNLALQKSIWQDGSWLCIRASGKTEPGFALEHLTKEEHYSLKYVEIVDYSLH